MPDTVLKPADKRIAKVLLRFREIRLHKFQKANQRCGHFFLIFPAGAQKDRMMSVLNRIFRSLQIISALRVHIFPGSHRVKIADEDNVRIRQQLIFQTSLKGFHIHMAVIIPGAFLDRIRSHLHFHIETGIVLILHVYVHPDSTVSGIIYQTFLCINFYTGNGDIQNQLQKLLTVLRIQHDRRKHKIILDR